MTCIIIHLNPDAFLSVLVLSQWLSLLEGPGTAAHVEYRLSREKKGTDDVMMELLLRKRPLLLFI